MGPREGGESRKLRPDLRVVMSAGGAVEPGLPAAAAAPSPAPARDPGPGHLFRPISAEDEEQQPTEIESLCMNCYRNVRRESGRWRLEGWAESGRSGGRRSWHSGPAGDLEARHSWGSVDGGWEFHWYSPKLFSASTGHDAPPAHQDPLLQRNNRELLFLRALWLEQHGDPVGGQDPGPGSALHFDCQGSGGERGPGQLCVLEKAWGLESELPSLWSDLK